MAGQLERLLVKIPSGASVSGEIDLRGYRWRGVVSPPAWTAARLTAMSRITSAPTNDGTTTPPTPVAAPAATRTTIGGVCKSDGTLVVFAVDAALQIPGQVTIFTGVEKDAAESVSRVTILSTNTASAAAVNQGADRYLWLIVEPRGV